MIELVVIQGVVPVALLAWLARGHPTTRGAWLLRLALVGLYLVAIGGAGLWLGLPRVLFWGYVGAFAMVTAARSRGAWRKRRWPVTRRGRAGILATGVVALVVATGAGFAVQARSVPAGPAVELRLPLRGGTYYVANGGLSPLVNAHLAIPDRARDRYRGQRHGVDLVRVDVLGRRARGLAPHDPEAYAIFGDTVFAPCPGRVVTAVDGLPDLRPPTVDRDHMAGNHVILQCRAPLHGPTSEPEALWVLLGHLRQGSVTVAPGEDVAIGRPLGRVGNTGRSDEPHLHVHAQRPGTADDPFGAEPIPMRFEGRFLSRNDRIHE